MMMSRNAGNFRINLGREIRIMRELTHARIVNLIEAFWETDHVVLNDSTSMCATLSDADQAVHLADVCLIVMDYAPYGTLSDKIEEDVGIGSEMVPQLVARQSHCGVNLLQTIAS